MIDFNSVQSTPTTPDGGVEPTLGDIFRALSRQDLGSAATNAVNSPTIEPTADRSQKDFEYALQVVADRCGRDSSTINLSNPFDMDGEEVEKMLIGMGYKRSDEGIVDTKGKLVIQYA